MSARDPMVSCILVARDRRWVTAAVAVFLEQQYEPRELIVVDDGPEALADLVPPDPRIRYFHVPGAGCDYVRGQARGEIVLDWDEATWYAPDYLLYVVSGRRTGLSPELWLDEAGRAWRLARRKNRATALPNEGFCVRFGSPPRRGQPVAASEIRALLGQDAALFGQPKWGRPLACGGLSGRPVVSRRRAKIPPQPEGLPHASVILLARDPRLTPLAIDYFLRQDYARRELLVVACEDAGYESECIRYIRVPDGTSAGQMRNAACGEARGEVIVHWDEDAWYAPHAMRLLVEGLLRAEAGTAFLDSLVWFDPERNQALRYRHPLNQTFRAGTGPLCYRRSVWENNRFPDTDHGESVRFVWSLGNARTVALPNSGCHVLLAPRRPVGPYWSPCPAARVRELLGQDRAFYEPGISISEPERPLLEPRPMVSCIMPLRGKCPSVALDIEYFLRQDYEPRELIVIDQADQPATDLVPHDPRVRYLRVEGRISDGAMRNLGCEEARGEIILHWDADMWSSPGRISYLAGTLAGGQAEVSGLDAALYYAPPAEQAWLCRSGDWVGGIAPASLCHSRALWQRTRFPDVDGAERAFFLREARPTRIVALPDSACQVGFISGRLPAAAFDCRPFPVEEVRRILGEDWQYHEPEVADSGHALAEVPVPPAPLWRAPTEAAARPLVSCIMPTHNRRRFTPVAISYFLGQDYEPRELIIVDDGTDPIHNLLPTDRRIRYIRLDRRMPIGAKRNLACEHARGEIILHWDDDDWHAPWQISYQVERLLAAQADVCGLSRVLFLGPSPEQAWQFSYPDERVWVYGGTLCYRRALWQINRFSDIDVGEDNGFVWSAVPKKIERLENNTFYVAAIHPQNTSPKVTSDSWWRPRPASEIREIMRGDFRIASALLNGGSPLPCGVSGPGAPALLVLGAGIGDVLRSSPLIRVLTGLGYDVDVLVEEDYHGCSSLLEGAPGVRRLFRCTSAWAENHGPPEGDLRQLEKAEYEIAVYSLSTAGSSLVKARRQVFFSWAGIVPHGNIYGIEKSAREIGWQGPVPPPVAVSSGRVFDLPPDTVVLHPGCKPDWPWKRWHGFEGLAELLPEVAVIGSAHDRDNAKTYFGRPFRWPAHVRDFTGRLSLRDTAALISQCRAVVSNDSGMMHLAAALGVPTFGVFGITSPEREAPRLANVFPITKRLPCAPACRATPGHRTNCERNLECLRTLTPEEVLAQVEAIVGGGGLPQPVHPLQGVSREMASFLIAAFPQAERFLAAGCANGFLVRALQEAGKECAHWPEASPADVLVAFDLLPHFTEPQALEFLGRARPVTQGCLFATVPWPEDGPDHKWHALLLRAGWHQDFVHRTLERQLQSHPLMERLRRQLLLYVPER